MLLESLNIPLISLVEGVDLDHINDISPDLPTVPHFVGLSHIVRFPEQKCGTVPHFGNFNGKFQTKNNLKQSFTWNFSTTFSSACCDQLRYV